MAARELARLTDATTRPAIVALLRREEDPWVRSALEIALGVTEGASSAEPGERIDTGELGSAGDETSDTLRLVVHEVSPILGKLRHFAAQEVPNYEDSQIRAQIDRLGEVLRSLRALGAAGRTVQSEREFDLSSALAKLAAEESHVGVAIDLAGPQGVLAVGDVGQVDLAVCNGLRNAVEAVSEVGDPGRARILITWGVTDRDAWVTILDRGDGISQSIRVGSNRPQTTKVGHQGVGLLIATRAARALGGEIEVVRREPFGTRFELRWLGVPRLQ